MDAPQGARGRSLEILLSMLSIFAQRREQNILHTAPGTPVASTAMLSRKWRQFRIGVATAPRCLVRRTTEPSRGRSRPVPDASAQS